MALLFAGYIDIGLRGLVMHIKLWRLKIITIEH